MNNKFKYEPKTKEQLIKWFKEKVRTDMTDFKLEEDFLDWYNKQEKVCFYCNLTERQSQEIVMKGWLTSNRFPDKGERKQGHNRGVWLEIDKKDPNGNYSRKNCVLACYFCNNDKSDVFESAEEYNQFKDDRLGYLKKIIERNRKNDK